VRDRIALNPLRAFDSDDPRTREVMAGAPRLLDRLDPADAEHFAVVQELLDRAAIAYEIDPTLVRGLDYYTRTVFEFTSDALGAQSGVGGGGRYDGLVELLGGPPTPGIGWAAGVERMLMAAAERPTSLRSLDLFVAHDDARDQAFAILSDALRAGLAAQMEVAGRTLKGQLKHADRLGARYVAVVEGGHIALRDARGGGEEAIAAPAEVVARVASG
jgi:histidyl-tRNA synthetase